MEDSNKEIMIAEEVIRRIKEGKIKMRSRHYFWLRSILYALLAMAAVLVTMLLVTVAFYALKINGFLSLPYFGLKGLRDMALSLPIFLVLVAGLFTMVAAMFLRQYPTVYQRPLIYLAGAFLIIFSLGVLGVTQVIGLRRAAYNQIENGNLFFASSFYDYAKSVSPKNITRGRVETVYGGGFLMRLEGSEEMVRAAFGPQTSIYSSRPLRKGDFVMVHGNRNGNVIGAFVIERIGE